MYPYGLSGYAGGEVADKWKLSFYNIHKLKMRLRVHQDRERAY
jgi:hypothetical protein